MKKKRRTSKSKGGGGTQSNKDLLQSLQDKNHDNCPDEASIYLKKIFTVSSHNVDYSRPHLNFSDIHDQREWTQYLNSWIKYASHRVEKKFFSEDFMEKLALLKQLFIQFCRVNRFLREQPDYDCNIHLYRFARIVILISFLIHEMFPDSKLNMNKYLDDVKKERIKQLEQIEIIQNQINQCPTGTMKSDAETNAETNAEANAEAKLRSICENAYNTPKSLPKSNAEQSSFKHNRSSSKYKNSKYKYSSDSSDSGEENSANSAKQYELANRIRSPNLHSVTPNVRPNHSNVPRTFRARAWTSMSKAFKLPDPPVSNEPVTPRKFVNRARAFSNRVRGWFGYSPRYKTLKKHRFF